MNKEEIDIKDIEFGEPIEEREPTYRDGYIRGIYRARNIIDSKQKEIERLNNIIKELEKYINETKLEEFENAYGRRYGKTFTQAEVIICNMILNKLQELKGSDK